MTTMEQHAVALLKNVEDPLARIKQIVLRSKVRSVEKIRYTVELINIARKHNLL